MKLTFKILTIIGVLSFIGGLMNDVIFLFGIIIALVFGYLGWRPKKEKLESKPAFVNHSKSLNALQLNGSEKNIKSSDNQIIKDLNQSEILEAIQSTEEKIKLLSSAFKNGILTKDEFQAKKKYLELEKEKLTNSNIRKQNIQNIIQRNKKTFDELDELRNSGLITNEEYLEKRETLISRFEESEIEEFLNYADLNGNKNVASEVESSVHQNESEIQPIISNEEIRKAFIGLLKVLLILILIIVVIYFMS